MLLPQSGRELCDLSGRVLADTLENVDQIVVRVDVVQPTGRNQALDDADVLGTQPGLPQLPNQHHSSSSSSSPSSAANPRSAARNSSEVAASNRLVLMLVLTEVFNRMRFNAIWRTSARLWATWPVRARA